MKDLKFTGILSVFLFLFMTVSFLSCEKDEDSPSPSGAAPVVDFNYFAVDPITMQQIDDNEAPVSIAVDFTVGFFELEKWDRVEIDYGNGIVNIIDPYDGRMGVPAQVYYSAGTFTIKVKASNDAGSREVSKTIDIAPMTIPEQHYLTHLWSIVEEKIHYGSNTIPMRSHERRREAIWFSPQDYGRFSFMWAEDEHGGISYSGNQIILTPDGGKPPITITVDSFFRKDLIPCMSVRTDVLDDDLGLMNYQMVFQLEDNASFYLSRILREHKWSIIEEQRSRYEYSNQSMYYDKLVNEENKEIIPFNLLTINIGDFSNSYIIDNWYDGTYQKIKRYWEVNRFVTGLGFDNDENQFLLGGIVDLPNDRIVELNLIVSAFIEEGGQRYRMETKAKLRRHEGSEAQIADSVLVGSWLVNSKNETIDGETVDPSSSNTPPIGAVFTFNSDGSASIDGSGGESWQYLDGSNFVITPGGGEEVLIHVNSYISNLAEIEIMSISNENGEDYELIYNLIKQ